MRYGGVAICSTALAHLEIEVHSLRAALREFDSHEAHDRTDQKGPFVDTRWARSPAPARNLFSLLLEAHSLADPASWCPAGLRWRCANARPPDSLSIVERVSQAAFGLLGIGSKQGALDPGNVLQQFFPRAGKCGRNFAESPPGPRSHAYRDDHACHGHHGIGRLPEELRQPPALRQSPASTREQSPPGAVRPA